MKDIEIEIQVKIENSESLLDFLRKKGEFRAENHQVDEYFSPANRNFIGVRPVEEWLRLRDEGGKCSINYKKFHFDKDGKSYHRDEYEIKIEDLPGLRKILDALDFKSIVGVDKLRKTWAYKNYEIAVDTVKGLGDFVEVEYKGKEENVDSKKISEEMIGLLKNLGCGKIQINRVGYPFQLLFPDEVKWEEK